VGESSLTLEDLIATIREFVKERDWEQYHRPSSLAMSASIELGELLELFQWKTDEEIVESLRDKDYRDAVGSEIADVLIYMLRLADVSGVELTHAITEKMKRNREKYPVEDWSGRAPSKLNRPESE
jgi:NTP pyrophosphatase (non-canonical NTP hydrolase)